MLYKHSYILNQAICHIIQGVPKVYAFPSNVLLNGTSTNVKNLDLNYNLRYLFIHHEPVNWDYPFSSISTIFAAILLSISGARPRLQHDPGAAYPCLPRDQ